MSKFKKRKKGIPAVNTAALPDIVFYAIVFLHGYNNYERNKLTN